MLIPAQQHPAHGTIHLVAEPIAVGRFYMMGAIYNILNANVSTLRKSRMPYFPLKTKNSRFRRNGTDPLWMVRINRSIKHPKNDPSPHRNSISKGHDNVLWRKALGPISSWHSQWVGDIPMLSGITPFLLRKLHRTYWRESTKAFRLSTLNPTQGMQNEFWWKAIGHGNSWSRKR